jgi:SAM-dependent methyltransferase
MKLRDPRITPELDDQLICARTPRPTPAAPPFAAPTPERTSLRAQLDPRRLLALPHAYRALMRALGADAALDAFVRDTLRVAPGDRVLDLGCGPGRLAHALPTLEYWGVDLDPRYIARARRARPHANFLCADVTAVSRPAVPSGCFDLVVALGLLHHLNDAQAKSALDFAYRALAPGGRLITLDCAYANGQHPVAETLARYDRGQYVRRAGRYLELAATQFETARLTVRHDLLRVPYTHAIVEAVK